MHIKQRFAVVGLSTVVVVGLLVSISTWQDWKFRKEQIAMLQVADAHALGQNNPPSPSSFHPIEVVPRPPLVHDVQLLGAEEGDQQIDQDELVICVLVDGDARAYPLNVMTGPEREVFNDSLGGRAIAATW